MNIKILVVDDHMMMREGLKALIAKEPDLVVVGEADNGKQLLALATTVGCHVVVMDVAMPDMNGIEATRTLIKDHPHIKVVALTGHANREYVREMLKSGASGYVLKSRAYEELVRAIREVMQGKKYLSPDIARGVVDEYVEMSTSLSKNPAFVILTDREREALQLIAEGKSTKAIATEMNISTKTAETHRRNIMQKLNLPSVAELTKYAIQEGVTSVDT